MMSQAPGILHRYAPGLVAFEHTSQASLDPQNRLLFVGGLGDGLRTVSYVQSLVDAAEGWGIVEVLTSSSYKGWGTGSVKRDVEELGRCVEYFRKLATAEGKLVLMGHSTGSQDTLQYLLSASSGEVPALDGAVLQAPVSDREAVVASVSKTSYLTSLEFSESSIRDNQGDEVLPKQMRPLFPDTPVSADRWFSLTAPLGQDLNPRGSEDFFSSDIPPAALSRTFGALPERTPLLILYSGKDQFVPEFVDKEKLVGRWVEACEAGGITVAKGSGVVEGANHQLEQVNNEVLRDVRGRVEMFLKTVDGGDAGKESML